LRLESDQGREPARSGILGLSPVINGHGTSDDEYVTFPEIEPGPYRASVDGETWTELVVTPDPAEQRVVVR